MILALIRRASCIRTTALASQGMCHDGDTTETSTGRRFPPRFAEPAKKQLETSPGHRLPESTGSANPGSCSSTTRPRLEDQEYEKRVAASHQRANPPGRRVGLARFSRGFFGTPPKLIARFAANKRGRHAQSVHTQRVAEALALWLLLSMGRGVPSARLSQVFLRRAQRQKVQVSDELSKDRLSHGFFAFE